MKWRNKQSGAVLGFESGVCIPCDDFKCRKCPLLEADFLKLDDFDRPACVTMFEEDPVRTMALLGWEPMEEANEMKEFTKADLKPGMLIKTRDGEFGLLVPVNAHFYRMAALFDDGYLPIDHTVNDDMTNSCRDECDIMEVYDFPDKISGFRRALYHGDRKRLWYREEVKEMTIEEVEALVGCKVKIVGGEKE